MSTTTTTSRNFVYESNKDYPPSPTSYTLGYSSYASPFSSSLSSSSSSVSNGSSLHTTPEPEIKATVVASSKVTNNKLPKKQYQCTQCLKNFSRPSALQTHSYTHTSEKPFQCVSPGCGRRFSVVSNLRRHFKMHQKPSVGNKLSSEDRLRYVRQLIINSDAILAKKQEQQQNKLRDERLIDSPPYTRPFDNDSFKDDISVATSSSTLSFFAQQQQQQRPAVEQQQINSSVNQYQHCLLLPKIHPIQQENSTNHHHYSNAPSTIKNHASLIPPNMTAPRQITNNKNVIFLYGPSSIINLPFSSTWLSNNQQDLQHQQNHYQGGLITDHHHSYPSLLSATNEIIQPPTNNSTHNQPSSYYAYMDYSHDNESNTF